jgi:hypothetical protein
MLVKLKEVVLRGFPQSSYDIDEELKQFHKFMTCKWPSSWCATRTG